jgi:hypothetical protein
MPFTPVQVDASVASEGYSQNLRLPEGYYLVAFKAIRPSGPEANTALIMELNLEDGPPGAPKGVSFTHWGRFGQPGDDKKISWTWGRPLKAAGMDVSKLGGLTLDTYPKFKGFAEQLGAKMAGRKFVALIGDDQYDGKVSSKLLESYPPTQWADFKGATVSTGNGQPSAAVAGSKVSDEDVSAALDGLLGEVGAAL